MSTPGAAAATVPSSDSNSSDFNFKSFILHAKIKLVEDGNNAINNFITKVHQLDPKHKEENRFGLEKISHRLSQLQIHTNFFDSEPPKENVRHGKKTIAKFNKFLNKFLSDEDKQISFQSQLQFKLSKSQSKSSTKVGHRPTFVHNDLIYQIVSQAVFDCLNPNLFDSQINVTIMDMLNSFDMTLDESTKIEYEDFFMLLFTRLSDHSWNFPGFNSPPNRKLLADELTMILNQMTVAKTNTNSNGK